MFPAHATDYQKKHLTNDFLKQLLRNFFNLDFVIIYSIDEVRKTKYTNIN